MTVFPHQFLQLLRPFVPTDDEFDRRFVETFAIPELRTGTPDYSDTRSRVLAFLNHYGDVSEETAVRILADELLMTELNNPTNHSRVQELVEQALVRDNQVLLEERESTRIEAIEAQEEANRLAALSEKQAQELEKERAQRASLVQQVTEANRVAESAREEASAARRAAEEAREAQRTEHERRLAEACKRRRAVRTVAAVAVAALGAFGAIALSTWIRWSWLETRSNPFGIKALALVIFLGMAWMLHSDRHRKEVFFGVVIAAVIAAFSIVNPRSAEPAAQHDANGGELRVRSAGPPSGPSSVKDSGFPARHRHSP
jgi:hypothetical protein